MRIKLIDRFLGAMAIAMLAGLISTPALSQVVAPTGKTEQLSSQLVLWYDNDNDDGPFDSDEERFSFIQVTNVSVDTPVNVHVQIFASHNTSSGDPLTAVICEETDFNDFYTPNDTHVYEMSDLDRNDPLNSTFVGDFDSTKGFVVITPIDGPGTRNAISHQHMFGNSYIFDDDNEMGMGLNSMGRDAVSFSSGAVVADATVLDGSSNGYILIQPEILKFNWQDEDTDADADANDADIVSIAFRDNYSGVFGYVAEPADATWTPLIFDDLENPISCSTITQNCFFDIGLDQDIEQTDELLGSQLLCPNVDTDTFNDEFGWVKMAIGGLGGLENEFGIIGFNDGCNECFGGAVWMHAEGPTTPVAPPDECAVDADCAEDEVCEAEECVPAPECTEDADCNEGAVCGPAGDCVQSDCADGIANDDDGLVDCADPDCAGQAGAGGTCEAVEGTCDDGFDNDANGLTDCADPICELLEVCVGGGGGGCAIASTASAGSAAANAIVVLIPLLGIGLRTLIRRREED